MDIQRRRETNSAAEISDSLVPHDRAVGGRAERDRRTRKTGREGTMRQVTRIHRTLVVLAVGLLALAAPLVAYASHGGPGPH